jgi:hypothetical protein
MELVRMTYWRYNRLEHFISITELVAGEEAEMWDKIYTRNLLIITLMVN